MKSKVFRGALSCSIAALATTQVVSAQEINIGISCSGNDQDVNEVTRNAVDQDFLLNEHLTYLKDKHHFREEAGWTWQGGFSHEDDPTRPFNKYLVASLLTTHGVNAQDPPISFIGGSYVYDESTFYLSPAFNRASEYELLVRSDSVSACQKVDPFTGEMSCARDHYENGIWADLWVGTSTYGRAEELLLVGAIPSPTGVILGQHTGSGGTIEYACPLFDHTDGVAKLGETMVHENWHGMKEPKHVVCPGVTTTTRGCADEWAFDAPRHSRYYNTLADATMMDSYQTGFRFSCDLTDAAQDWVPLMTQLVANKVAADLGNRNIFQNIKDSMGNPTGLAPYSCGAELTTLQLVPGVDSCSPGRLRCDAHSQCNIGLGEECVDGCCTPPIIVK